MPDWPVTLGLLLGAILAALLPVWIDARRKRKEVEVHGKDDDLLDDLDDSIDDALSGGDPDGGLHTGRPGDPPPGRPDADSGG